MQICLRNTQLSRGTVVTECLERCCRVPNKVMLLSLSNIPVAESEGSTALISQTPNYISSLPIEAKLSKWNNVYRFQNVFLRCPTPGLHCFPSSHWPSFMFLSFMASLITSIKFYFGLPRALFCFGIHFNALLGNLPSAILCTWPYQQIK